MNIILILSIVLFGTLSVSCDENIDCDVPLTDVPPLDICVTFPSFFDTKVLEKCLNVKAIADTPRPPYSLNWIKNVETAGCVTTSEKLLNGSSLLSSTLFEFLTSKVEKDSKFSELIRPAVDTCYGDMTEVQLHRLEAYNDQAVNKADGGYASSPISSFILECVYAQLVKLSQSKGTSEPCQELINYVNFCGVW